MFGSGQQVCLTPSAMKLDLIEVTIKEKTLSRQNTYLLVFVPLFLPKQPPLIKAGTPLDPQRCAVVAAPRC